MAKPKKKKQIVRAPLTHAMEMYHEGYAHISTGEVKLTAAGRRKLGKAANGVKIIIAGMPEDV